jgi:hypothetical protein
MKNISWFIALLLITMLSGSAAGQTLNWSNIQEKQKHIVNLNFGWNYAATVGVGYAYKLNTKIPVALNAQLSVPTGKNVTDDFKSKLGVQARVFKSGNFLATVMVYGLFRRYEQRDFATLQNFGGEFTGVAGYYKSKWFVAGEFGFDKAIATNIRHGEVYRQYHPSARNGWYVPTGGNFHYGIQGGYTLGNFDLYSKVGRLADQNFKSTMRVPWFLELGVSRRF